MTAVSTLPSPIRAYLHDFVVRARLTALARAAAVALACFVAWMIAWCLLDRFLQLHWMLRLAALLAGVIGVGALVLPRLIALAGNADLVSAAAEVERRNPRFGQRLLTVTSRLLGAADYRGSDEILIRLTREVGEQVAVERSGRLVPVRCVAGPLSAGLLLACTCIGLSRLPSLGFARLVGRFIDPLAAIAPVTTTTLDVSPGDCSVIQSKSVTIRVSTQRLGDAPVTLFLNGDDHDWTRIAMSSAGGGKFTFDVASVDRDLQYYVTGGDARSPIYRIRVLRAPTISQFHISYDYPAYTRLPPTTVTNTDGHIEAPAGTKVLLAITATEPLQSALLHVGQQSVLMDRGRDDCSRQANLVVGLDAKYGIDLISARDVAGTGPAGMSIQALPDLPPQVRLARGGDSLRLNPRDIIPIWYEALDDYGIKSLVISAQVNDQSPITANVRLWGDPRRQQDVFNFDLATLPLGIGDVVKLTAIATDTAGHITESLPLRVIISPRSIDLDAWERIGELRTADQLCRSLVAQFDDAVNARSEADAQKDHSSTAFLSAESRSDRALSAASQTATLLRQSLLRATTHSHTAALSTALADWVDAAEVEAAASDEAFRESGAAGGLPEPQRQRLRAALRQIRSIQPQIAAVGQGEQAAAILADFDNLQAARKQVIPNDEATRRRLRETMERMRQDIAADASQIGLDGNSNDLANQLQSRIAAETNVISANRPIDFTSAARQWSQELRRDPQQRLGLEGRLSAAAQAEALRPEADLPRARNLELASRAAASLGSLSRNGRMPSQQAFAHFVADLSALLEATRSNSKAHPMQEDEWAAVQDLRRLAENPSANATRSAIVAAEDRQKEAESLALQASAAAASHQYGDSMKLDQAMVRRLQQLPQPDTQPASASTPIAAERLTHQQQAVQREMATAQTLDELGRRQEAITADETRPAPPSDQQREVADRIADIARNRQESSNSFSQTTGNGRDRAASEVLAAQDQLSAMPQALAAAETAAAARREAAMRSAMAVDAAQASGPDQRAAADRAVDAANENAADAAARLNVALEPVSSKVAQSIADRLQPFAPEADASRASLLGQLAPALDALGTALHGDDQSASDRAAYNARRAMESCQRDLAGAQNLLMRRDPLIAAKWFARAAAQSLAMVPPDVGHARSHQANASAALSRAWDQSIHQAAAERLASLPSLSAVLAPPPAGPAGQSNQQGSAFAAAREWGRMRPQDGPDLNTSLHEADPPGFEASLKLYFEALGKAQESK